MSLYEQYANIFLIINDITDLSWTRCPKDISFNFLLSTTRISVLLSSLVCFVFYKSDLRNTDWMQVSGNCFSCSVKIRFLWLKLCLISPRERMLREWQIRRFQTMTQRQCFSEKCIVTLYTFCQKRVSFGQ